MKRLGRAYAPEEKEAPLAAAKTARSPSIYPALIRWEPQFAFESRALTPFRLLSPAAGCPIIGFSPTQPLPEFARTLSSPTLPSSGLALALKLKSTSAGSAPKKNRDVLTWRFVDLINVAVEIGIVSRGAEKLSHSVCEYRNLVHPNKELKDKLRADEQEARITLQVY